MTCHHCDKGVLARGLCSAHYNRHWRRGTIEYATGKGRRTDLIDPPTLDPAFWERVDETTQSRILAHSGQSQRSGGNL